MLRRLDKRKGVELVGFALCVCLGFGVHAEGTLVGKVVEVIDGDTITVLDLELRQHRIRLSGIDAPERGQPFGHASQQHLAGLTYGKLAQADCYKLDRYKREICTVNVDGKDVGLAQLDAGLAWWYRKYANEQPPQERLKYEIAETKAYGDRIGLWSDAHPIAPWTWRNERRISERMGVSTYLPWTNEFQSGRPL